MLAKPEFEKNDFMWRMCTAVAVVSGVFSVLVFTLLIVNYLQIRSSDPIDNLLVTELREQYAEAPEQDLVLAERIQQLDLLNRKAFFTSQAHLRTGGLILLISVTTFLIAFKNMARWRPDPPELAETPAAEIEWLSYAESRTLLTWTGVGILAVGLLVSLLTESRINASPEDTVASEGSDDAEDSGGKGLPVPTWDEVAVNWPSFRGPGAYGKAHFDNAPVKWDKESGEGIVWKTPLDYSTTNSPVVWGNRIFLSNADEDVREIIAYDTETGEQVWKTEIETLPSTPREDPAPSEDTGYAAATMVAHGEQVFAIYANGDVASVDFEGNLVWSKSLGLPDNHYGHSSSLIAYDHLLFVQFDQAENSKLFALETSNGKLAWKADREIMSWASPIIAHTPAGPQLILCTDPTVDAYDPLTGKKLWSQECLMGEVAPSAAYADGIVFAAMEYALASAITVSGTAEEIQTEIIWEYDNALPEVSSPVGDGERFYITTSFGDVVCLDAKTGEELWLEEVSYGFNSSPILVGDRIYVLDNEGTMYIIRASSEYELIASPALGETTVATPAFLDGRIYLRTAENLYCIQ